MKPINVGVIGFGTIGGGVVESLINRRRYLKRKTGVDLRLKLVCDKDLSLKRRISINKGLLTKDANVVLNDPEIDIIVELIGGIHPAGEIIRTALKNGKHVVTANKALLCKEGVRLFDYARKMGRAIRFEASVGGGVPIIKALTESLIANDISAIYGIVNGTCNYILRSMQVDKFDYRRALENAKRKGFAEKNASYDVNGVDSAHKLALLTLLGFGKSVGLKDIYREGITEIQPWDMEYAATLGYSIKLMAIAKKVNDALELRVHPTLVDMDHPLSNVRGVNNAIYVKGDLTGESLFYGKGAGRYPTASVVVSDLIDIARFMSRRLDVPAFKMDFGGGIKRIRPIDDIRTRYYIRFQAIDRPGVLAAVARVLAQYNISIASVNQVERRRERVVPIIMLTHEVLERSMSKALKSISALAHIKPRPVAIRIERL